MDDIVALGVFIVGGGLTALVSNRFTAKEKQWIWIAFAAHAAASILVVIVTRDILGGGDLFGYHRNGVFLAEKMRLQFDEYAPRLGRVLLQIKEDKRVVPYGLGRSTGSMFALSAFLSYGLGKSVYALCAFIAMGAHLGKIGVYATLRRHFPQPYWGRLAIGCMLVPSAIFWSAGLLKEAVVMGGLGALVWGAFNLLDRRRVILSVLATGFGVVVIGLFKGYILIPFFISLGVYVYFRAAKRRGKSIKLKPVPLLAVAAISLVLVVGVGKVLPRYDVTKMSEEFEGLQTVGARTQGGSNYTLGAPKDAGVATQMAFAPLALMTALFRPLIVEARNAQMAVSGLEMLILTLFILQLFSRFGIRGLFRVLFQSPMAMFSLTFVLVLGLGVGLGSTNLGTLSRYRMPMMPFYVSMVLMLLHPAFNPKRKPAPRKVPPVEPRVTADAPSPMPEEAVVGSANT